MDALHILYDLYPTCLKALWWVDITSSNENATLDTYEIHNGRPHPLVMVAWRCRKLKELVIIGEWFAAFFEGQIIRNSVQGTTN